MAKKFVHLHVHSEYSLLDGLSKISNMLSCVKEDNIDMLGITDHGVMYGVIEFYKKCTQQGVKPIIGMEGYITNTDLHEKNKKSRNYHILLLAKNLKGYRNLMRLTSIAHLEGYYYRPRVDKELLKKYSEGLICTSACPQGELGQTIITESYDRAKEIASWYLDVFGDDYYMEIQRHNYKKYVDSIENEVLKTNIIEMQNNEEKIVKETVKLSREMGIPLVATNDVHYVKKEDAKAQDALVCISTGKKVDDVKRLRYIDTPTFYLKKQSEMYDLFNDLEDACENTYKIAKKCNLKIQLGSWLFPEVDLPEGKTAEEHLKEESERELKEEFEKVTKELKDRLDYELGVIIKKGYASYFLIFRELANWANERNIPINTRGSAAGSLVSYVLGITNVDPVFYKLPFERFLNPYRPKPPDIDLDIADNKREEMIEYMIEKYGRERVAQICTFGRMLARGSVRDVARVLGYPYNTGDKIAKLIPLGSQGFPMTIDKALKKNDELRHIYESDKDARSILKLAKQIEGNARHTSVHAAGIVISPKELIELAPVQLEPSGDKVITQYEMHACEDVGLIKLDILGIRNLSILGNAVSLVKEIRGELINLDEIPLDDGKTFEMLSRGETMGTFQLSGSGMTRYLVELEPERIEDIMAMIALFRPGPMENIPEYIARKKGKKKVSYYHPKMKKFLNKSFGILVYQEDLLFTAMEMAGYDWESVDKFRNAVGKKIPEEMAKQHKIFVKGCMKYSKMSKEKAEGLWELFEPFQGYGFNKAHAASYGIIAYRTAYMKANYPVEFMCALLTAESSDNEKVSSAVNECRKVGIQVYPPDINKSDIGFTIVEDQNSKDGKAILFGLSAIKHVGKAAISEIIKARSGGIFVSFSDFLSRVDARRVNKKVIESLIKVGALSEFGKRAKLLSLVDEVRNKITRSRNNSNQQGLFSGDEVKQSISSDDLMNASDMDEFSDDEIQSLERQLLGFSLSAKPIDELINSLIPMATHKIQDIFNDLSGNVRIALVVDEVRIVVTKTTGKEMAFVRAKDDTGSLDLIVFPRIYQETRKYWVDNKPLLVTGRVDNREESNSLIVEKVDEEVGLDKNGDHLYIRVPEGVKPNQLKELKTLLMNNVGEQSVSLLFEGRNNKTVLLNIRISWDRNLASEISRLLDV